jgi:hypothetical protein
VREGCVLSFRLNMAFSLRDEAALVIGAAMENRRSMLR